MFRFARFRILLLAVLIAAGHVALVSHAAAHFMPGLEQCELCVSQAQPLAGIPVAEQNLLPVPVHAATEPGAQAGRFNPAPPRPFHQRAPPSKSS